MGDPSSYQRNAERGRHTSLWSYISVKRQRFDRYAWVRKPSERLGPSGGTNGGLDPRKGGRFNFYYSAFVEAGFLHLSSQGESRSSLEPYFSLLVSTRFYVSDLTGDVCGHNLAFLFRTPQGACLHRTPPAPVGLVIHSRGMSIRVMCIV